LRRLMSSPGAVSVPPFEFRALEVALEAICSFLEARTKDLESTAHPALDALTKKARI
jgi:magnesium transporter